MTVSVQVMRPMYQKYHEVKHALESMRASLERTHGPLPADDDYGGTKPGLSHSSSADERSFSDEKAAPSAAQILSSGSKGLIL